jgi:glycosyltransferase involved in cell wall biosynthesis
MAMGMALVSTTIGCEGLDVRAGQHLVVADTPATFANETVALLADPHRRLALGSEARALVERQYSWSVVGRQLLNVYADAQQVRGQVR